MFKRILQLVPNAIMALIVVYVTMTSELGWGYKILLAMAAGVMGGIAVYIVTEIVRFVMYVWRNKI